MMDHGPAVEAYSFSPDTLLALFQTQALGLLTSKS